MSESLDEKHDEDDSFTLKAISFFAKALMVLVWCTIGLAVWIALVVKSMLIITVISTFVLIGRSKINKRITAMHSIAVMWPNGLKEILSIDFNRPPDGSYFYDDIFTIRTVENFIGSAFYTILLFSIAYILIFGFDDFKSLFFNVTLPSIPFWNLIGLHATLIVCSLIVFIGFLIGLLSDRPDYFYQKFALGLLFLIVSFCFCLIFINITVGDWSFSDLMDIFRQDNVTLELPID